MSVVHMSPSPEVYEFSPTSPVMSPAAEPSPSVTATETLSPTPVCFTTSEGTPEWTSTHQVYHMNTRPANGSVALLLDPGSVGNLCGDKWAYELGKLANQHGLDLQVKRRDKPLQVSGVGSGTQQCNNDYRLPVALHNKNTGKADAGFFETPAVENSELPGLLGLNSLRKLKVILDLGNLRMHIVGPGDFTVESALPPGTDTYDLEIASSGHLLLPCSQFQGRTTQVSDAEYRSLLTREVQVSDAESRSLMTRVPDSEHAPVTEQDTKKTPHYASSKKSARARPPPPRAAPNLDNLRAQSSGSVPPGSPPIWHARAQESTGVPVAHKEEGTPGQVNLVVTRRCREAFE